MDAQVQGNAAIQPSLYTIGDNMLTVVVGSLSLGGAQRIVLDWARRIYPMWRVRLFVVHDKINEWAVPDFIEVTRLHENRLAKLFTLGQEMSRRENPTVLCHLINSTERQALIDGGAKVVNVVHNAAGGWLDRPHEMAGSTNVIAVSEACALELRAQGWQGSPQVIRHLPARKRFRTGVREKYLSDWKIPHSATVVGMVGAVKPQKNYPLALKAFAELLKIRDAYLVIVGGPLQDRRGLAYWDEIVALVQSLGLRKRVAMPGFVGNAVNCLPAFDSMLNTSDYEGLSIATLEALANGKPVVASKVGGQGEITSDDLFLIEPGSSPEAWARAIDAALSHNAKPAPWAGFPSHRLWTLAALAHDAPSAGKTLFLTENLNSGGAQRSLVNLHLWAKEKNWQLMVCGNSAEDMFYKKLLEAGIPVSRSADSVDAFDHAEALVHKICAEGIDTVVFWNLDPKVKLLLMKALGFTKIRFVDVSPGYNSFKEMDGITVFSHLVAYSREEMYGRLDDLVLKFDGPRPELCRGKTHVIRNGVPLPQRVKRSYEIVDSPRIVVNGRISPSKFLIEIIEAVALLKERIPKVELHIIGGVTYNRVKYGEQVFAKAHELLGAQAIFHGPTLDGPNLVAQFDAYLVLGLHQGCPNALLEAMSAGVPVVANDAGGTREQVIDGVTGLLVPGYDAKPIADALYTLLTDRGFAQRLAQAGKQHVDEMFSMEQMVANYRRLLCGVADAAADKELREVA